MHRTAPLLSICILTYNRAALLLEAVESILSQVTDDNLDRIEVVVCDNASTDDTPLIMNGIKSKARVRFNYHRNEANLGYDRNLIKAVEIASGEYCWLFCDDDLIFPGAVDRMLIEIEGNPNVDVFMCNYEEFDLLRRKLICVSSGLSIDHDKTFDFKSEKIFSYLGLVRNMAGLFGFTSVLVLRRAEALSAIDKSGFVGSDYIHIYLVMAVLWREREGVLKYLSSRLVRMGVGSQRVYEKYFFKRTIMEIECVYLMSLSVFSDPRSIRMVGNIILRSGGFSQVVNAKILGGFQFYSRIMPPLFRNYWSYPVFWLRISPLFFIPGSLLRFLRWAYRSTIIIFEFIKRKMINEVRS